MNWDAVGAVAEITASIVVIVSLIYIVKELRQSTKTTRAMAAQEFVAEYASLTNCQSSLSSWTGAKCWLCRRILLTSGPIKSEESPASRPTMMTTDNWSQV